MRVKAWWILILSISLIGCQTANEIDNHFVSPPPSMPPTPTWIVSLPEPSKTANAVSSATALLSTSLIPYPVVGDTTSCERLINSYLAPTDVVSLSISPTSTPASPLLVTVMPSKTSVFELGITSYLDGYAWDIAQYWEEHQEEGIEGLRERLQSQHLLCKTDYCPFALTAHNLDMDDTLEYIFVVSDPADYPASCGASTGVAQAAYILNCQVNHCQVYRIRRLTEDADWGTCINGITDLNLDQWPDVVITYYYCGASDCWERLEIVSGKNGYGYDYLVPEVTVHNTCLLLRDQDGDQTKEILALNVEKIYAKESPLSLYKWDGQQYVLYDWVRAEP
jgi:hypothetical protein